MTDKRDYEGKYRELVGDILLNIDYVSIFQYLIDDLEIDIGGIERDLEDKIVSDYRKMLKKELKDLEKLKSKMEAIFGEYKKVRKIK